MSFKQDNPLPRKTSSVHASMEGLSRHTSGHIYGAGKKTHKSKKKVKEDDAGVITLSDADLLETVAPMEKPGELRSMKGRKTDLDMRTDRRSPMYDYEIVSDLEEADGSPLNAHGEKFRKKALKRSKKTGAERGDEYDYEDPKVQALLKKANKADQEHEKKGERK